MPGSPGDPSAGLALGGVGVLEVTTERLVVISKPPDPQVARRVAEAAAATGKPAVLAFPGLDDPPELPIGVGFAGSLEAAAAWAAGGGEVGSAGVGMRRKSVRFTGK